MGSKLSRTMRALSAGAAAVVAMSTVGGCSLSKRSTPAPSQASSAAADSPLDAAIQKLATDVKTLSPGTEVSLAVRNLKTNEFSAYGKDVKHVSASTAKVVWIAAAVHKLGVEKVARYAEPIMRESDNVATGHLLELVGPDDVNTFMWKVAGMKDSAFTRWLSGERPVHATNSPRAVDGNYFTAEDVITFLTRLDRGELLKPAETETVKAWMKLSPDSGLGGWLGTALPAESQAKLMHKAGWLEPGCCGSPDLNTLNEMGIVEAPDGTRYAVAILTHSGEDFWGKQVSYVEQASRRIYDAVTAGSAPARTASAP